MRPALSAREIAEQSIERSGIEDRFNEARAFCAGNRPPVRRPARNTGRFNEARAFCAGNREVVMKSTGEIRASMRPALSAREIVVVPDGMDVLFLASMRPALSAREITRVLGLRPMPVALQ